VNSAGFALNKALTSQEQGVVHFEVALNKLLQLKGDRRPAETLVFIDSGIEDYEVLRDGVLPGAVTFVLNAEEDGILQITRALDIYRDVRSIYIVSHGNLGTLYLGSSQLNLNTIEAYHPSLQKWADALASDAQILLYGCRVAEGDRGLAFIQRVHGITRANVAASTVPIGHVISGNNWHLDVSTQPIETSLPFASQSLEAFTGTLIRIEAEDYIAGTNGIEYFDTTAGNAGGAYRSDDVDIAVTEDIGGGFNVGYVEAGENLTYSQNIAAGVYDITVRVASARSRNHALTVTVGGSETTFNFGRTGGWQTWEDVTIEGVFIEDATQLRVDFLSSDVNLNYIELTPIGSPPTDEAAPTATLSTSATAVVENGSDTAIFTIELTDDIALDVSTLDNLDVQVSGPAGSAFETPQPATFVSVDVNEDGTPRTATYAIAAPADGWQTTDDGNYTVTIVGGEILDTSGQSVAAGSIGSFTLSVPTDEVAPTATLFTNATTVVENGSNTAIFTIQLTDDIALDVSSLDDLDVQVSGPAGSAFETPQPATFVSVDVNEDGTPRTATYAIAAPAGGWQATDDGNYTVTVVGGEILDTSGNSVAAGSIGSFTLSINDISAPTGPIRIEAEDYIAGTNGVEYFDTTAGNAGGAYRSDDVDIAVTEDIGGGFNVGYVAAGEYLTYNQNIAAGVYDITARVASGRGSNQALMVTVGGSETTFNFGRTGGWQNWIDVTVKGVFIEDATQLRVDMLTGNINLNYIELIPVGSPPTDEAAPTATLSTSTTAVVENGSDAAIFTIQLTDDIALDVSSLDNLDVQVSGPAGSVFETPQTATFVSVDVNEDGTPRMATYAIAAPAGGWQAAEDGNYTVTIVGGEILDTSGNSVAAGSIGSFTLSVPTDEAAPTATLLTSATTVVENGGDTAIFTIELTDDIALDVSTLDNLDVQVSGPAGSAFETPQPATFVSVDVNEDGSPRTATYAIAAPADGWQTTDDGNYTVTIVGGEILDTSGNSVAAGSIGSFTLSVPTDEAAPTATLYTIATHVVENGSDTAIFIIDLTDDIALDVSSLDDLDVQVSGPTGSAFETPQPATFVRVNLNEDGTPGTAAYAIAAPTGGWQATEDGDYTVTIVGGEILDTSGNSVAAGSLGNFTLSVSNTIRIQAEEYIGGTNGVEYFDTTAGNEPRGAYRNDDVDLGFTQDIGGGFHVGYVRPGEYLNYNQNIAAGEYNITVRVASGRGSDHRLMVTVGGSETIFDFDQTGGFQTWQDVTVEGVFIEDATQLRVEFLTSNISLNYIELTPVGSPPPDEPAPSDSAFALRDNETIFVSESAGVVTIPVVRTGSTIEQATVEYTTNETGEAASNVDYETPTLDGRPNTGQVFFDVGEAEASIVIPIINDETEEGNETFAIGLQNPSTGGLDLPRTVLITIVDDDSPTPIISVGEANISVLEGLATASVTVLRSGNTDGTSSVDFTTSNGTAVAGDDYIATSGTLNFAPGEFIKTLSIPLVDDVNVESTEEFIVNLSTPTGALLGDQAQSAIAILDNDSGLSDLTRQTLISGLNQPTTLKWTPDGRYMLVAEVGGTVRVVEDGTLREGSPLIDISDQVNSTNGRGLLGLAIHPNFPSTPYLYLLHTYDPPEVYEDRFPGTDLDGPDGSGNRPSRLVRVEVDPTTMIADPASLVVIAGTNSIWEYTSRPDIDSTGDLSIPPSGIVNGTTITAPEALIEQGTQDNDPDRPGFQNENIRDYLATDSHTHTIGDIHFGPDGYLYFTNGDGTSYNFADPRTVRVQDINNLSGKVLRIDPITGAGAPDNPFFEEGDPFSNQSKVFQSGLRNPFRFAVDPLTGLPVISDVGWNRWEEINTGDPGANFGWPYFEGPDQNSSSVYRNLDLAQDFYANGSAVFPILSRSHGAPDGATAIMVGDFYDANTLIFGDINNGTLFAASIGENRQITDVQVFDDNARFIVDILKGPDGGLYGVNLAAGEIINWG